MKKIRNIGRDHGDTSRRRGVAATGLFVLAFWFFLTGGIGAARDRIDITFSNHTLRELIEIQVDYKTSSKTRRSTTRVCLDEGESCRIDLSGAIEPVTIMATFSTGRLDFNDLSGLDPRPSMNLTVMEADDGVWLRQDAADGAEASGVVVDYVTENNSCNAGEVDALFQARSMADVERIVAEAVARGEEAQGELEPLAIETSPIFDDDEARERCARVAAEWSEENAGAAAGWTGKWDTTGETGVCNCMIGAAGLDGTLFRLDDEITVAFPVFLLEQFGSGLSAPQSGGADGITIRLRAAIQDSTLDDLWTELCYLGYQPWLSRLERRDLDDVGRSFAEADLDRLEAWDLMMEDYEEARDEGSFGDFQAILVSEATYATLAAGGELAEPTPCLSLQLAKRTYDLTLVTDCRELVSSVR